MHRNGCLPGFMGETPALVVRLTSSTGDGRVEDYDAVVLRAAGVYPWECGISQESSTRTGNEADAVDVQSAWPTLP